MRRSPDIVRLIGEDADVRAVAREAVAILQDGDFVARLRQLNTDRVRWLATAASVPRRSAPSATAQRGSRVYPVVWGTLLAIAMTAALVFAVQLDAPTRRNRFLDTDLSIRIAVVTGLIAVVLLLISALLRMPNRSCAVIGETVTVLILAISLWVIGYRLVVGVDDSRGFTGQDLASWMPFAVLIAVLLLAVGLRCDFARRRMPSEWSGPTSGRVAPSRKSGAGLRRVAVALASEGVSPAQRTEWASRLEALRRRGAPDGTIDQALTMTPRSWLAWLCYDGEIEAGDVLTRG